MDIEKLIVQNPGINITVNANDLLDFAQGLVENTARIILEKKEEKVYSRNEVIDIFHVASATLWRWEKLGLIHGRKIGNRKFYPESEIKRLLNQ